MIGNFDGVNGDDVLLQRNGTGTSFLLPSNAQGELYGISQYINGWGTDSFRILAGNFNGGARDEVFLQARQPSANSALVMSDGAGRLTVGYQSWDNSYLGFKWSVANAIVHLGDFNNDGRDDLLVQAKADTVLIDYDIPIRSPCIGQLASGSRWRRPRVSSCPSTTFDRRRRRLAGMAEHLFRQNVDDLGSQREHGVRCRSNTLA